MTRPDRLASPTRAVVSMKTMRAPVRRARTQNGTTRLAPEATTTPGRTARRTAMARARLGSTRTGLRPYSGRRSTRSPRRSRSSACGPGDVTHTRGASSCGPTAASRSRWPPGDPARTVTARAGIRSPDLARQRGGVDAGLLAGGAVPCQLVQARDRRGAQALQQRRVGVELAEVPGESVDVAGGMDEAGAAVLAAGAGRVGHGEDAAARLRLVGHERAALLDGRQDEHVAVAHELREVGHVAADLDARVLEQRRDGLAVAGDELAADADPAAGLAGARALPRAQRVVQALARLEAPGEQGGQRLPDRSRPESGA